MGNRPTINNVRFLFFIGDTLMYMKTKKDPIKPPKKPGYK